VTAPSTRILVPLPVLTLALALGTALPARAGKPAKAAPATPSSVAAPKLDVKTWTLPNGLQVLFLADHKAPIATVQVFYHV
jgi:hypothetical protein